MLLAPVMLRTKLVVSHRYL